MINANTQLNNYEHHVKLKHLLWVTVLPLALVLLVSTIPLESAYAQNSSQNTSGTKVSGSSSVTKNPSVKNQSATNKSVVKVAPGSTVTISSKGNKTTVSAAASATTKSNSGSNPAYNKTGFTNLYVLSINGKTFPIKYSIVGGKVAGLLADKDRTTVVAVLNPSAKGGNMTIEIPRHVMDSKGAANADTKYQVKIDGKGVDYKEVANNANARVLSINFSKDNRFMEIIGTQMAH